MLEEEVPGPHVSETQIANRIAASKRPAAGGRQARDRRRLAEPVLRRVPHLLRARRHQGRDDHAGRRQYRGMAKLVVIGQTGQGQDIVALKVTKDARNVADGSRPAMLFSAVNHAREWIAAEVGRRMPTWWLEHADDPQIAELLSRTELWFLPIQNPDGYDYTFTCGTGFRSADNEMCGATLVTDPADPLRGTYVYKTADGVIRAPNAAQPDVALRKPTQRLWRKTVRDNDGNETVRRRPGRRRPEPQLPDRVGPGRGGRERQPLERHVPRPDPVLGAREPRVRPPAAQDHARGGHQLPLGGAAAAVPVRLHHRRLRRRRPVVQGDHGHRRRRGGRPVHLAALVGPLHHQRRDHRPRVQQVRVDVLDARARRVRDGGRRHVLHRRLRLHVPGRRGQGRGGLREEPRLRPQRRGDDARPRPARPPAQRDGRRDAVPGQGLAGHRAEPVQRLLRRRPDRSRRTPARCSGRSTSWCRSPAAPAAARARSRCARRRGSGGERFGDLRGKYYQRVRAQIPADFVQPGTAQTRPAAGGRRRGQRPRDRGLPAAAVLLPRGLHAAGERPASGCSWWRPRTTTACRPNKTPYADAPRYLDEHVAALQANGYTVETFDVDTPPAGPNGRPGSKQLSDLGVLSHFDAVLYYTGDDLVPQAAGEGVTDTNYRRGEHPRGHRHVRPHRVPAPGRARACATPRCCATT